MPSVDKMIAFASYSLHKYSNITCDYVAAEIEDKGAFAFMTAIKKKSAAITRVIQKCDINRIDRKLVEHKHIEVVQ